MKKALSVCALVTVLLLAVSVTAADKVVVIPLNSGKAAPDYGGVQVVTSTTGQVWMDRNLGALRSAINRADPDAYGALFQWGRLNDGHAWRISSLTTSLSSTDVPGHGSFIIPPDSPYDWRNPQNDNLWQGVSGTNNPCPQGFRLPTEAEWEIERASWSSNDAAGAFASPLKLVPAGFRYYSSGSPASVGSDGYYWSSTMNGIYARSLNFYSSNADMLSYARAYGFSVRCLKD